MKKELSQNSIGEFVQEFDILLKFNIATSISNKRLYSSIIPESSHIYSSDEDCSDSDMNSNELTSSVAGPSCVRSKSSSSKVKYST